MPIKVDKVHFSRGENVGGGGCIIMSGAKNGNWLIPWLGKAQFVCDKTLWLVWATK